MWADKVHAVLNSPVAGLFVALCLAALAASGRLSVNISNLLLIAAFFVGCFGIHRAGYGIHFTIISCLLLGVVLTLISWWLNPSKPTSTGVHILTSSITIPPQHSLPKSIKELPNNELRVKVIELANNMRDFENNFKTNEMQQAKDNDWLRELNASMERRVEYAEVFRNRFYKEAMTYRDELTRRLNLMPSKEGDRITLLAKDSAGSYSVNDFATYIEKLAKQLP